MNSSAKPARSVDGFLPPRAGYQPPTPLRPTQPAYTRPHAQPQTQPAAPAKPKKRSFIKRLGIAIGKFFLGLVIFAFAFFIQSPVIGQLAIFAYAIAVFIWHIPSRTTFMMAVMGLTLVLFSSIRSDVTLAGTFARYVFLLLIIGTFTLWREVRSEI